MVHMSKYELIRVSSIECELYWVVPEPMREAELDANPIGTYLVERPCNRPYHNGRYYLATITLDNPAMMGEVMREWSNIKEGVEAPYTEPDAFSAVLALRGLEMVIRLGLHMTVIRDLDRFNRLRAGALSATTNAMFNDNVQYDKSIYKNERCASLVHD